MAGGGGGRSAAANSGRKGKFSSPIPIKKARIEIVPLIDVMFFLLAAFMMVSLSLQQSKTRPMELIDAKKASDDFKPDVLNIGVEKDGTVAIGTNVVDDRSAPYRAVGGVLQQVRLARFTRVSFVTRESERARD